MYNPRGLQQYKNTDISSMPREKIVVLLYERMISDLQNAIQDCERDNRLEMTKNINHASRIISELRVALDHEIGGEISANLDSIYQYAFAECLEQLLDRNPRHARNAITVLEPLLNAWRKVPVGTAEKAERERKQGMKPANHPQEAAAPPHSAQDVNAPEATTHVGSLSVSA